MSRVEEVRRQIEDTRHELDTKVEQLVTRTRHELDWKARLRKNLPKVVIGVVAVVGVVAGVIVLKKVTAPSADERARLALTDPVDLEELAVQLKALREELDTRVRGDKSLTQRMLLRATTAAGTAGGALAAKALMERFAPDVAAEVREDPKELARNVAAVA